MPDSFIFYFHFQKSCFLPNRKALKQYLADQLLSNGKTGATLNVVFCNDEDLLEINRTHLNHNYYTDIISFDLSQPNDSFLLSDIYISIDRVRENAATHQCSFKQELHRVVFHGILHLLGYKDKEPKHAQQMRQLENQWLNAYFP